MELFNTLPDELSTARKDVVVKSEILDTVLQHGMLCFSNFTSLFYDCRLTANQDGDSFSGDREDVIVKSEVIETEMMSGMLCPSIQIVSAKSLYTFDKMKSIILLMNFLLLLQTFQTLPDLKDSQTNKNRRVIMIYPFPKCPYFKIVVIDSATAGLELRVKEEPTEIQLPGRYSSLSDRKKLPRPSTSRTTTEIPRQLAPDNSRYNSNVQVKPEPVDDPKTFFSSNRHFPVPRDRQRSMLSPKDGNSLSSRDPRKRPSK